MPDVVAVAVPPLQAVLAEVKSAFFGLCVQTGKEVLAAMMEADRVELCGAKGQPNAGRGALRGGHTIPGLGSLMVDAVLNRDFPVIQGLVLFFSVLYVLINLLVDLSYLVLDPRIRY